MHGFITTTGQYCGMQAPTIPNAESQFTIYDLRFTNDENSNGFRVYPNPTDGKFTVEVLSLGVQNLEPRETELIGKVTVEIYSMKGDKIHSEEMSGERKHEFSIEDRPIGIYLVRMVSDGSTGAVRILKR